MQRVPAGTVYVPPMMISKQFALMLGVLAVTACGGGGSSSPDATATFDAPSQVDAAAHADAAPQADAAPTADAGPQSDAAPTADAASQADATVGNAPVTVTVFDDNNSPAMGLPVAFLNADGTVVLETTTDITGTASATMASGGSVTVGASQVGLLSDSSQGIVYTWLGVAAGDVLTANQPVIPEVGQQINVNVSSPADANGADYQIFGFCPDGNNFNGETSDGSATSIMVPANCTPADFYVAVYDTNGDEIDDSYSASVALADGANVTLGALVAVATDSVSITTLPGTLASNVNMDFALTDGTNVLDDEEPSAGATNGTVTASIDFGAFANLDLMSEYYGHSGDGQFFDSWTRGPSVNAAVNLDFTALMMASITATPTFDLPSNTLSWTEAATGTADAFSTQLDVESSDQTTRTYTWEIVAPHQGTSLVLPTLPTSLSDFNILNTDTVTVGNSVLAKGTVGYDVIAEFTLGTPTPQSNFDDADLQLLPSGATYTTLETDGQ